MNLLDGRVAVVTGGSSGIGRGIALSFAEHGAKAIVVADIRTDPKEGGPATHEQISDTTDATGEFVHCDVSTPSDFEPVMDAAENYDGPDILVNNAGIWRSEEFLDVTEESYQQILDINLKGAYFASQAAAKRMIPAGGGSIINISSIAGLFGNGNWPSYAASKGGLTMLTYSLAHRLADDGIRVNAIHPGGIATLIGGEHDTSPEETEAYLRNVPLGRYGEPADVAGPAVFLASELAGYVTGESLVVDGGWTSWR